MRENIHSLWWKFNNKMHPFNLWVRFPCTTSNSHYHLKGKYPKIFTGLIFLKRFDKKFYCTFNKSKQNTKSKIRVFGLLKIQIIYVILFLCTSHFQTTLEMMRWGSPARGIFKLLSPLTIKIIDLLMSLSFFPLNPETHNSKNLKNSFQYPCVII